MLAVGFGRKATRGITAARSFAAVLLLAAGAGTAVLAQETLPVGGAFVTGFSGTTERIGVDGVARTVIDPDGVSGRALDLSAPGRAPDGTPWEYPPELFRSTAAQTGQVFGVALDDATSPNVYLTATSAFGLHRNTDNTGWMDGMWGPEGGPGTVWKLDAGNGYAPEFFARITLDGRLNTGAGLGNIAYDAAHLQLFVSDLETGMIHRLQLADGLDLGHYDHGVEGRTDFVDAATGAPAALAPVTFDPAGAARITDCPSGDFQRDVSCWNFADFRRRVWGLDVGRDARSGEVRLYYAVWGSQGFGKPDFAAAPEDERRNSVWSVRIAEDGSFDTADVRREFILPDFFRSPAEIARAGFSNPVSDIAFSELGGQAVMLLAERGGARNLGLGAADAFAVPQEARVLRYRRDAAGVWQPDGRQDVGYQDRAAEGTPYLRAGAAGGVTFGMGYDAGGMLDTGAADGLVWMTGDALCAPAGPCPDGTGADGTEIHGLQGAAPGTAVEVEPAAAFAPYPAPGPATPPDGPDSSYMIDAALGTGAARDATWTGDIAFHQSVPVIAQIEEIIPWWPPDTPDDTPPGDDLPPELGVAKYGPDVCDWERQCAFLVTVTNHGPGNWDGPVQVIDIIPTMVAIPLIWHSPSWSCVEAGPNTVACEYPDITLAPGDSLMLMLRFAMPAPFGALPPHDVELENCAVLPWFGGGWDTGDPVDRIAIIEFALMQKGYFAGPVDGLMDPALVTAIAAYRADEGLPPGGIDEALFRTLYPGDSAMVGDANPDNDFACWPFVLPGEDWVPPAQVARDLRITKTLFDTCVRDEAGNQHVAAPGCRFIVRVENVGTEVYEGLLSWLDSAEISGPGGGPVPPENISARVVGDFLSCEESVGGAARCSYTGAEDLTIVPGDAFGGYEVFVRLPSQEGLGMENCVLIDWADIGIAGWDQNLGNDWACESAVIPLEAHHIDLGVGSETTCVRGESCSFEAWIENFSDVPFEGAAGFTGSLDPALTITAVEGVTPGLVCGPTGAAEYQCLSARLALQPGARALARITVEVPADFGPDAVDHVKELIWLDAEAEDANSKNDRHVSRIEIVDPEEEEEVTPPPPGAADLALSKLANQGSCMAGSACGFSITVRNVGDAPYSGPLTIGDAGDPWSLGLAGHSPGTWDCDRTGGTVTCTLPEVTLSPGQSTSLSLRLATGPGARGGLSNCASIDWLGPVSVREVQEALNDAGFDAGVPDGVIGPRTRGAIRAFQAANGIAQTGEIDPSLIGPLLGRSAQGDAEPANDRDCAQVNILPQPVVTPERVQPEVTPPRDDTPPPPQDDDQPAVVTPQCPSGFKQVSAAQAKILQAQGREIRAVTVGQRTILCVGPQPEPPSLQCPAGFQQVSRNQAKELVQKGYEIRQVREGQQSILCARPGQQQPPAQIVPPAQILPRVVPPAQLQVPQVTPKAN